MRPYSAVLLLGLLCLPAGAQEPTVGLIYHDSTQSYQGYTLFAPLVYNVTYLIDNQGRLVRSWPTGRKPSLSVYLLEDGSLLHTAAEGGSGMTIYDWDGNAAWSWLYVGDSVRRHHDVEMLPSGNILVIATERKSVEEALASGRDSSLLSSLGLRSEHVVEVDTTTGDIVWEWHAWDHMVQDFDSTRRNWGVVRDRPELIDINYGVGPGGDNDDFIHLNSIDYNAELDQVILSPRIYSEVWVIDHSTSSEEARGHSGGRYGRGGDLLYRWGNPESYRRGDSSSFRLMFQHDAHWIPDSLAGAGHLIAFNNGSLRPPERLWSSVDEWVPPVDSPGFYHLGPDSAYGPAAPTWRYRDTVEFFSSHISGAQRLPNGNTLVCEGRWGTLFEVTPDSEVVWKYVVPVCSTGPVHQGETLGIRVNETFRCYRYSPDFPGFEGRSLVPGDPIELPAVGVSEPGRVVPGRSARLSVTPVVAQSRAAVALFLPVAGDADLAVFDCRGARVATIASGTLARGEHWFEWDAGEAAGGVYFCRLACGAQRAVARFAVIH